jgi:hypothetical protein
MHLATILRAKTQCKFKHLDIKQFGSKEMAQFMKKYSLSPALY